MLLYKVENVKYFKIKYLNFHNEIKITNVHDDKPNKNSLLTISFISGTALRYLVDSYAVLYICNYWDAGMNKLGSKISKIKLFLKSLQSLTDVFLPKCDTVCRVKPIF